MKKTFLLLYESGEEDSPTPESGANFKLDSDLIKQIKQVAEVEEVTIEEWITHACYTALEQSLNKFTKSTQSDDLAAVVRANAELILSLKEEIDTLRQELQETPKMNNLVAQSSVLKEESLAITPINAEPMEKKSQYPEEIKFSLKSFSEELEQPFWSEAEMLEAKLSAMKIKDCGEISDC